MLCYDETIDMPGRRGNVTTSNEPLVLAELWLLRMVWNMCGWWFFLMSQGQKDHESNCHQNKRVSMHQGVEGGGVHTGYIYFAEDCV
jgi:hypothetical protein